MTQAALSDFDAELEAVKRARANIDTLRKQRLAQPEGSMVGKQFVAPHWSQYLAPMAQDIGLGMQEGMATQKEGVLNKAMQADREKWVGSVPKATQFEVPGPVEEGQGPLMSSPVQPSQQEKLAWAAQGERNPLTKALASQYGTDVLIKEPERAEARQQAKDLLTQRQIEHQQTLATQQVLAREKLKQEADIAKQKSEDTRLSIEQRAEATRQHNEMMGALNQMKMSVEPSSRAKERTKLEEQVNSIHSIDSIVESARPLLKNATGSGIGSALDTAAGVFGITLPGSKEAGDLKVVEANLMKHQPKFKGTDSDRDTKLYQKAAADIGNASTPNAARETAINTVQRLARKDMEVTHRLAANFNMGSGEHLPRIDIPDMPPPLPPEKGAVSVVPSVKSVAGPGITNPNSVLPKATRQVSGAIGGLQPAAAAMPQPVPTPGGGIPPGVNVPTNTGKGPAVTAQLPPAEIERANILMSEYNKGPTPPPPGEDPSIQAGRDATDKASLKRELARIGVDADTGGPLQRRATDKTPAVKVRTWNREKGAFE